MFPKHDPYFHLIQSIAEINGCKIELVSDKKSDSLICQNCNTTHPTEIKHFLAGLKLVTQELITTLKDSCVNVDYSDRYKRAAYMLAYFPFYVEPIYYVLKNDFDKIFDTNSTNINISFIGGGPLPELLGLGKIISSYKIKNIECSVLDNYNHWVTEREFCTLPMLKKEYSYDGDCHVKPVKFNFWDENLMVPPEIAKSDLIVSQNCINDCPKAKLIYLKKNIVTIWKEMKKGASLVIIDLNYDEIKILLQKLKQYLINNKADVIRDVIDDEIRRSSSRDFNFNKCWWIEELYLKPRSSKPYVKFHSLVAKKVF